jgi:hypothetical protein
MSRGRRRLADDLGHVIEAIDRIYINTKGRVYLYKPLVI